MTQEERYARLKAHPEKLARALERHRIWRDKNRERVRAKGREAALRSYYKDHEKSKARNRANQLKLAAANVDKLKIRGPIYRKRWYERLKRDHEKITRRKLDCGYDAYPSALHFDHVFGQKSFNIPQAKSISMAAKEIEKCVVRCANCHAVRHAEERGGYVVT